MKLLVGTILAFWALQAVIWFWVGPVTTLALFPDPRLIPIVAAEAKNYVGFVIGGLLISSPFGLAIGIKLEHLVDL